MNDPCDDEVAGAYPGSVVTIVKLRPDGSEAATYPGTVIERRADWIVARATWAFRRMQFDYATFEPGDHLVEYFSTELPFNAFALFSRDNEFKCWYSNITLPARIENRTIYWHDLFVDVVQRSSGEILVLDEDELAAADLSSTDPDLHRQIEAARDLVVEKMRSGHYPFSEIALPIDH